MNLNMVISFLIGGLLLMAILALNSRVIQNSGQTVVSLSAKSTVATINSVMQRDFMRIGYNLDSGCPDAFVSADSTKIVFCADVDEDISSKAKEISWEWNTNPSNEFTSGNNPDDYKLIRKVNGNITSLFPVTDFSFKYYDTDGNETGDISKIHSISITMKTQSAVRYGKSGYATSVLNKTFTPPNLNLAAIE